MKDLMNTLKEEFLAVMSSRVGMFLFGCLVGAGYDLEDLYKKFIALGGF